MTESGVIHEFSGSGELSHNEEISALVSSALDSCAITARDLSGLVISRGPGSFTGLRIGYAFAKGLALGLGLRMYPICSLRAAAFEYLKKASIIAAIKDARRQEVYFSLFSSKNDQLVEIISPQIVAVEEITCLIAEGCHNESVALEKALIVSPDPELIKSDKKFQVAKASHTASGLLQIFRSDTNEIFSTAKELELKQLADLSPSYYRSVEAKTVDQRRDKSS